MPKTIAQLAKQALAVQDACNLSGVVHTFSSVLTDLWSHAEVAKTGTDWVNKHPISILFSDKIAHLTGTQYLGCDATMDAYAAVKEMAK